MIRRIVIVNRDVDTGGGGGGSMVWDVRDVVEPWREHGK
jgi:hypothetical protein